MLVHLDGARIANAAAALGGDLRSFTIDAGVDVMSFGGTKNGMMYGEAVVFCNPTPAELAKFVRKQLAQLPSKVRYISAQFLALLEDDLWLELAAHANEMAASSGARSPRLPASSSRRRRWSTACSRRCRADAIDALQKWCFFYIWDELRARGPVDDGVGHRTRRRRRVRRRRRRGAREPGGG